MNGLKKSKCKVCKNEFTQFRTTQIVCSHSCAIIYANKKKDENKVQEKRNWLEKKKKWKEELETIPELIKKVEKVFNEFIRIRDEYKKCISCNKDLGSRKNFHAGHYYSAGNYSNVRFDERNVNGQCIECNLHLSGNLIEYRKKLEEKINDELVLLDNIARDKMKWDREELNKLLTIYKLKIKIIEEENKTKKNENYRKEN